MTWSLVNTITTEATSTIEAQLSAPFTYFYETFLPSRGWAVTKDESGGSSQNSEEGWWALSKAFTFPDGATVTCNRIHEIEYNQLDMNVWDWTGVPGEGLGSQLFVDSSWTHGLRTGLNYFHFLASDENPDSWCVIANKRLLYWSHPSSGIYMTGATDLQRLYALGFMACYEQTAGYVSFNASSNFMYHGQAGSFYLPAFIMTPSFSFFGSTSGNFTVGQNTSPDVYSRFTNTTGAYGPMACEFPSSVLIDGEYYLDLYPSSTGSLMLKTGATDLGVLL